MYIHEEILLACMQLGKKQEMTVEEVVAEMGQAIHVMLSFNKAGLDKHLSELVNEQFAEKLK